MGYACVTGLVQVSYQIIAQVGLNQAIVGAVLVEVVEDNLERIQFHRATGGNGRGGAAPIRDKEGEEQDCQQTSQQS